MFDDTDADIIDSLKKKRKKKSFREVINQSDISSDELDELFLG